MKKLKKIAGRAIWVHEAEWDSERLTLTAAGTARLVHENGGWNGAFDSRSFKMEQSRILMLEDAATLLNSWGVPDDDLAQVRSLAPFAAALML